MRVVFRIFYTITIIVCLAFMMISADFNTGAPADESIKLKKQHCFGYTVIEAGKGIDCYGDTIKLVKTHGYFELVSHVEKKADSNSGLN